MRRRGERTDADARRAESVYAESPAVEDAKAAADRGLAVAKEIISEADARRELERRGLEVRLEPVACCTMPENGVPLRPAVLPGANVPCCAYG